MSMPVIDAVVRADRPFVIQGYGKTYELTEDEFNAAMRAADALSDGRACSQLDRRRTFWE